jgi:hypothetical protein
MKPNLKNLNSMYPPLLCSAPSMLYRRCVIRKARGMVSARPLISSPTEEPNEDSLDRQKI